jgi:hypothetical protein
MQTHCGGQFPQGGGRQAVSTLILTSWMERTEPRVTVKLSSL